MPPGRVELPRPCGQRILSPSRLPVPPQGPRASSEAPNHPTRLARGATPSIHPARDARSCATPCAGRRPIRAACAKPKRIDPSPDASLTQRPAQGRCFGPSAGGSTQAQRSVDGPQAGEGRADHSRGRAAVNRRRGGTCADRLVGRPCGRAPALPPAGYASRTSSILWRFFSNVRASERRCSSNHRSPSMKV